MKFNKIVLVGLFLLPLAASANTATLTAAPSCIAENGSHSIVWKLTNSEAGKKMDVTSTELIDGNIAPDPTFTPDPVATSGIAYATTTYAATSTPVASTTLNVEVRWQSALDVILHINTTPFHGNTGSASKTVEAVACPPPVIDTSNDEQDSGLRSSGHGIHMRCDLVGLEGPMWHGDMEFGCVPKGTTGSSPDGTLKPACFYLNAISSNGSNYCGLPLPTFPGFLEALINLYNKLGH